MQPKARFAGVIIVLGASLGAAAGLLLGQIDRFLAVGIAMVGILIGSALARGNFQPTRQPDSPAIPLQRTNDQRQFSGKE